MLVPVDSAIMKMTRKPYVLFQFHPYSYSLPVTKRSRLTSRHQNEDGSQANDQQAEDNVARFIAAHIVPVSFQLTLINI